jgi:uncharacterized protein YbaP (TraB family)
MKTTQIKSVIGLFFFGLLIPQLQGQSLLWEISGNGLTEKSYLYGTIHIQDKRVFRFDSIVWERFDASKQFAAEFDIERVNPQLVIKHMMMPTPYSSLLLKEDLDRLEDVLRRYTDVPFAAAQNIKPFFLSALISQSVMAKDETDALDLFLLKKARKDKKKILELESFNEQMAVIDSIPLFDQLAGLLKVIRERNPKATLRKESENLIAAYLSQDDTKLYQLILESEESELFMKNFLIDRNHNMVKRIRTFIADGSTFIAVGAGHLAGDEGLVNLLRKEGYILTPIEFRFIEDTSKKGRR